MLESSTLIRDSAFLVTGAAGFIGSHLTNALLALGARRVIALDSLRYGSWSNLDVDERVEMVEADLAELSEGDIRSLAREVDFVYHLAAEKHNQSRDDPDRVIAVNISASRRLFAAAAAAGTRKIVFASSLYAVGRMSLPPMREDDLPEPRTVYGISKVAGEHLLRHIEQTSGLRWTTFRLFFVYGPRQFAGSGYKSVIMTNFERIARNEAPVIFGDGEQSLDYVHVDDVVEGLLLGLNGPADRQVIHLGSGTAVSVNQLTDAMLRVAGSSLQPLHAPADWTAGSHRVCDNEKARRLLGWTPAVTLPNGLATVYRWMTAL